MNNELRLSPDSVAGGLRPTGLQNTCTHINTLTNWDHIPSNEARPALQPLKQTDMVNFS